MESCFDRLRRPKHPSHPESAGFAGAVRGATPNFERGPKPNRTLDTPVHCRPARSATLPCPSQKFFSNSSSPNPGTPSTPRVRALKAFTPRLSPVELSIFVQSLNPQN